MFMRDVFVAGASTTRFGKFPDTTVRALAEEATRGALHDAGQDTGPRRAAHPAHRQRDHVSRPAGLTVRPHQIIGMFVGRHGRDAERA